MSSRANIVFQAKDGAEVWLHRQHDGAPDIIESDLNRIARCRNIDTPHLAATQLIIMGAHDAPAQTQYLDPWTKLGGDYELVCDPSADIEYLYVVRTIVGFGLSKYDTHSVFGVDHLRSILALHELRRDAA